jgi:hypothetical protein
LNACLGAVAGHTTFGLLTNANTAEDRIFLGVLAAIAIAIAVRGRPASVEPARRQPAAAKGRAPERA